MDVYIYIYDNGVFTKVAQLMTAAGNKTEAVGQLIPGLILIVTVQNELLKYT